MTGTSDNKGKYYRILGIWQSLNRGRVVHKEDLANQYGVSLKTIQRDLDDIRSFMANQFEVGEIIYDAAEKGYYLQQSEKKALSSEEILMVCKILLESQALTEKELFGILDKLIMLCDEKEKQSKMELLIRNEKIHYEELENQKPLIQIFWTLAMTARDRAQIQIEYRRIYDGMLIRRNICPLGIMLSEKRFYLIALHELGLKGKEERGRIYPIVYHMEQIEKVTICDEKSSVANLGKNADAIFRQREQSIYIGKLSLISFEYSEDIRDDLLDELPTAKVIGKADKKWIISAEVLEIENDELPVIQNENVEKVTYMKK